MNEEQLRAKIEEKFGPILSTKINEQQDISPEQCVWKQAVVFAQENGQGNMKSIRYFVLNAGTDDESAVFMDGFKDQVEPPVVDEAAEAAKKLAELVAQKKLELQAEAQAKKELTDEGVI